MLETRAAFSGQRVYAASPVAPMSVETPRGKKFAQLLTLILFFKPHPRIYTFSIYLQIVTLSLSV